MSAQAHELSFVAQYWRAAQAGAPVTWQAQSIVSPNYLRDPALARIYSIVSHRFTAGDPVGFDEIVDEVAKADATDALSAVIDVGSTYQTLMYHAERLVLHAQAREQADLLTLGVEEAVKALENPERARRIAERLSMRLLEVFASDPNQKRPQTREELIADQLDRMDREEDRGVVLPWPRMQEACGPWMPGELVGLTGYSGSGKSTVTANLAMGLARRGNPVIVFPTEMREQWVSRSICTVARFPQWVAEKGLFKRATDEERRRFAEAAEAMLEWPWEVVNRPNVTPSEIVAAVRTLRRKYPGQTVTVVVDHMHRLDYGSEEADDMAGKATRMLKNFASDDRDGLVFVLLYQPKKPENEAALYQPIHANRIRGHSMVWNELDVHLSVFRAWGERSPFGRTEWSTDAVMLNADGSPRVAKPFGEGAVLNSEHVFLKPDKRRVGGEGPTFYLNIHAPSGQMYETAERAKEGHHAA